MDAEVPNSLKLILFGFSIVMIIALGYFVYLENTTIYANDSEVIHHIKNPLLPSQLNSGEL